MSEGYVMLTSPSLSTGLAAIQPVPLGRMTARTQINTTKSVQYNCGSNRTAVVQFAIIPVPVDGTGVVDTYDGTDRRSKSSGLAKVRTVPY